MAKPKNPVRAARQAGRQLVKTAKTERKVAKVQARATNKVAKINAKTAKYTGKTPGIQPQQGSKAAPASSPKPAAPKTGLTGKDLLTYGVKPKAPVAKGPSYAPFKSPAAQQQSQQMTADAKRRKAQADARQQEAAKKKAAADEAARKKKAAADAKRKKEAAEKKKQEEAAAAAAAEEQRKKDMFLQEGETRENTLPYIFTEKAKRDAARKAVTDFIGGMQKRFSSDGSSGNSKPAFEPKSPGYGQRKRGGAVKKSLYNKRK